MQGAGLLCNCSGNKSLFCRGEVARRKRANGKGGQNPAGDNLQYIIVKGKAA